MMFIDQWYLLPFLAVFALICVWYVTRLALDLAAFLQRRRMRRYREVYGSCEYVLLGQARSNFRK